MVRGGSERIKATFKAFAGSLLVRSGIFPRTLGERGVVLAFHRVTDAYNDSLTVGTGTFREVCEFAKEHFTVVPLKEIVTRLERGRSVANMLAITFDDGYEDNFTNAAPILEELGLPATIFVVSQFIESNTVAWWDSSLRSRKPTWMTWAQVETLAKRGVDIGGYTMTHIDLGKVTPGVAIAELAGCREVLQHRLGKPIELFAYPYGGVTNLTEANRQLVRQAGFRCCLSCNGGTVRLGDDPFRLARVPISSWFKTPEQFALEVALGRA